MDQLRNIGFYTLSDARATSVSWYSDLYRCELLLTDRCNFRCSYCRGVRPELRGDISFDNAKFVLDTWGRGNVHNIRFSGGEPTLWKHLVKLVSYARTISSIEHIALSTNGSASISLYDALISAGVNDFSVSFDACCASTADKMAGVNARFDHLCNVIEYISKKTYCSVGVVIDQQNSHEVLEVINCASSLGVSDIRIIPSAQYNQMVPIQVETRHPILKYRLSNLSKKIPFRGLSYLDTCCCHLVKDDMAVVGGKHYPCIIYLREQGEAIGKFYGKSLEEIRNERRNWFFSHNTHKSSICRSNCLDVCRDYNNKVDFYVKSCSIASHG